MDVWIEEGVYGGEQAETAPDFPVHFWNLLGVGTKVNQAGRSKMLSDKNQVER
ncbi:MAG: hypothetical protein AB1345_05130 [Chloroflexota bacterium]